MLAHVLLKRGISFVGLNLFLSGSVLAATYNESVSGDISTVQTSPTTMLLTSGANSIIGNVGGTDHQDYITLTVPAGFEMTSYVNAAYSGGDVQGFTGFQNGSVMVGNPGVAGTYTGYAHFGTGATNPGVNGNNPLSTVGINLLPSPYMAQNGTGGTAQGATGFTPPLGAGDYSFLIQQSGSLINYEFDINVTATPEPASLSLLALGGAAMLLRRRR